MFALESRGGHPLKQWRGITWLPSHDDGVGKILSPFTEDTTEDQRRARTNTNL